MNDKVRRALRDVTPPIVSRMAARQRGGVTRLVDGFATWPAAVAAAGTYSEESILERVRTATDDVRAGKAAFERDGVLFDSIEYRWPVVAGLMWQAARDHGSLRVLDFGGSLGSTFRQYQALVRDLDVRWAVVEQPSFVNAGRAYSDDVLSFHESIEQANAEIAPNVVLLSSVLQYLPDPHEVLASLAATSASIVIIDRTPLSSSPLDIPVVQVVPESIYRASYPAWVLSRSRLLSSLEGWRLLDEFAGIEPAMTVAHGTPVSWSGLLLERKRP